MDSESLIVRFFSIPILALVFPMNIAASEYSPGNFGASESDFKKRFDVAEYDISEELVIRCGSRLGTDGRIRVLMCLSEDGQGQNSRKAVRRISRIVKRLKLEPAVVDGEKVQVWYNFSVILTPGESEIAIINNHLYNQELLGKNYSAPQRYDYPGWRGCLKMPQSGIFIGAQIGSDGEILGIDSVGGMHGYDSCLTKASNNVRNSRFIPAHSNGVPVAAVLIEIFY